MKETMVQYTDAQLALKLAVERSIHMSGPSLNTEQIEKVAKHFYDVLTKMTLTKP